MCRPDRSDPFTAGLAVPDFVAETQRGATGLRVAVSSNCGCIPAGTWKFNALEPATRALADAGAQVEYVNPPIWNIRRAYVTICEVAFAAMAASMSAERMALLDPALIETARRGMMTSAAVERQAQLERIRLAQSFIRFFLNYDLMLLPCVPIPPSKQAIISIRPTRCFTLNGMTGLPTPGSSMPRNSLPPLVLGASIRRVCRKLFS